MQRHLSRRDFVKSSLLASAAVPLALRAEDSANPAPDSIPAGKPESMPKGIIAGREYSRLMMGGNLIAGWAHSRDLPYVSTLMRRYNTLQNPGDAGAGRGQRNQPGKLVGHG
jgi:hypothetical protein